METFREDFLPGAKIILCPAVRGALIILGSSILYTVPILCGLWKELSALPGKLCLVFLDSKNDIELLAEQLNRKLAQDQLETFDPESIAVLHADLPYAQRKQVLEEAQKTGKEQTGIRLLLASSTLELGVHLPNIQTVVNIGWPITHKNGLIQRNGRNRSQPREQRVNIQLFDEQRFRDRFYKSHPELFRAILTSNSCSPILYPRQNPRILAALIVLQLQYGITDAREVLTFFKQDGILVEAFARQAYTLLLVQGILWKKENTLLLTDRGQEAILSSQNHRSRQFTLPTSIRAISDNWTIELQHGFERAIHRNNSFIPLGTLTVQTVLRQALPGNSLIRNKQQYLVTAFDREQQSIVVKKLIRKKEQRYWTSYLPANRLATPEIVLDVFPQRRREPDLFQLSFGSVTVLRRPKALVIADPDQLPFNQRGKIHQDKQGFYWQHLSPEEAQDLTVTERSEGLVFELRKAAEGKEGRSYSTKSRTNLLKALGKVLRVELEASLFVPTAEISLAVNSHQLALYDRGEPMVI